MAKPLFSIITVTYNAEKTVKRTIESVINQNRRNDIEYIIVDGASGDGTMDIVRGYGAAIDKTISEKDSGIYDAMNKGLAMAAGVYVWFINAGDTVYAGDTVKNIAEQVNALPSAPDVIYGETAITGINGEFLYMRRLKSPEKLNWKSFKNGMLVSHQSFIVKKAIAPEFDRRYRFSSDFDWCIRCMKQAGTLHNTHLTLSGYLNEGTTTQNLKASLKERFKIMRIYYGSIPTYLRHIKFAIRFGLSKLTGEI